jgi:hypothetical protein
MALPRMKTPTDKELHLFALAMMIAATEDRVRIRLSRTVLLSAAALGCRLASLDILLIASLALASREFVPGCVDLFKARLLRHAFGNMDCG